MTPQKDALPADPSRMAPFRMAQWEVFPAMHRLHRGDRVVQVEQRVMHVLVCLASHPGEVITRDAFFERVWPETVVVEKSLTNIISELRGVLEDDPGTPKYIETIRRSGYRLVAPVIPLAAPLPSGAGRSVAAEPPRSRSLRRGGLVAAAILALGAILIAAWLRQSDAPESESVLIRGLPLTSDPGREIDPALSPDGNWVAYSATGAEGAAFDIYVKPCHAASWLRLTDLAGNEVDPAWSPDGSTIAFVHQEAQASICTVPAIGGAVRTLIRSDREILGLSWSPDGKHIAFGGAPAAGAYLQVMLVAVETLETRQVNDDSPDYLCAFDPRFSPDGTQIAFTRADIAGMHDLYVVPVGGGACRRLTSLRCSMYGLDWTRDGRSIVFSASPRADFGLWRVALADGGLTWIPTRSEWVTDPQLSRRDERLVFEDCAYISNIWCVQTPRSPDGTPSEAHPLIVSTRGDFAGRFSPDGKSIAFVSKRTGEREIWLCDADGGNPRQMTHQDGARVLAPRWSPDGRHIAFSSVTDGWASVHVLDCETAAIRQVRADKCHALVCWWSRDGKWIYFDRQAGNEWELWRLHPDGTGAARISDRTHNILWEGSADGTLYCAAEAAGVARLTALPAPAAEGAPAREAEPHALVAGDRMDRWVEMALLDEGAYFIESRAANGFVLGWYDFASGESDSLAILPSQVFNLSVAPDGSALLFDHPSRYTSDLVLVDGFR